MPTPPNFGKLSRERVELSRTKRALSDEVDDLIRQKASLSAQLELLRHELEAAGLEDATETFAERNRRFFESFIDREVYRVSRENHGRFSTLVIDVQHRPPPWFTQFLRSSVRVSDVAVRQGGNRFWVFLHGAGALGRRLFVQRLAANFQVATLHHGRAPNVAWGGSSFPRDGDSAGSLLERAVLRREPLPADRPADPFGRIEIQRPVNADATFLLPPRGLVLDANDQSDPQRVVRALHDAVHAGQSGELLVRSDKSVGRVYIYESKVAWAHCSLRKVSLAEHLIKSCGADRDEIRFAFEQCRQRGGNFAETLIEFGTFSRNEMRGVLLQHLRRHMDLLLRLEAPDIMFLPQSRIYRSDLLFPLTSLIDTGDVRGAIVDQLRSKSVSLPMDADLARSRVASEA